MLKLLLGHWKSHRKKPPLLPEEGDIHFEEPSTINPLFEDSDSSISSSNRPTDVTSEEQNKNVPQRDNERNVNENDAPSELVDVSVPKYDSIKTIPEDAETAIREVDTVIEEIESLSNNTIPKTKIPETKDKDDRALNAEVTSKPTDLKNEISNDLESVEIAPTSKSPAQVKTVNNYDVSKDETKTNANKSEDIRILDQPSTSAIKQTKKSTDNTINKEEVLRVPTTSVEPEELRNTENKITKSDNKNLRPTSMQLKSEGENSRSQQNNQSDLEKPAKLRAKAIDELIKKFQGSTTDSSKQVNKITKPDIKSLLDDSKETKSSVKSTTNFEKKNKPSPSIENYDENNQKMSKLQDNTSASVTKSKIPSNASNKSEVERESLANIFKFPPPPPLEQLQNKSSLHGKIAKDWKFNRGNIPPTVTSPTVTKTENDPGGSKENEEGQTRSDSSLERTRTSSSNKLKTTSEKDTTQNNTSTDVKKTVEQIPADSKNIRIKDLPAAQTSEKEFRIENEISKIKPVKEPISALHKSGNVTKIKQESKLSEPQPQTSSGLFTPRKESPVPNPKSETNSNNLQKPSLGSDPSKATDSPVLKKKSSISKSSPKVLLTNENDNIKSHSEDSGITRGDQISSETTQDNPQGNPSDDMAAGPNASKKNRKDKKLKSIHKKSCKNFKRTHDDNPSIKRSQYDEYYDGLTGIRHLHRGRHSDSWNSDLSWEEKELLRRLRSKRGTVRSNTPSTRSRHSRHRYINEEHFRRLHNFRRSMSDESTFYGSSSCSCDECLAMYVKDYAYGRASLRGMSPIQEQCTCRSYRHNMLGRRVQFRSDTIHETSPSEKTTRTTTPAPPTEKNEDDNETDDKNSQQSSKAKDDDSVRKPPGGVKEKKSKAPEDNYRFMTPWELEEWDLFMRKHLLKKRRKRAQCMGIMALAMVVFIGLVVAILMVYLRRKVI